MNQLDCTKNTLKNHKLTCNQQILSNDLLVNTPPFAHIIIYAQAKYVNLICNFVVETYFDLNACFFHLFIREITFLLGIFLYLEMATFLLPVSSAY